MQHKVLPFHPAVLPAAAVPQNNRYKNFHLLQMAAHSMPASLQAIELLLIRSALRWFPVPKKLPEPTWHASLTIDYWYA
ncbi:hypothetical protein D3C87_1553910 [compost metagenome]